MFCIKNTSRRKSSALPFAVRVVPSFAYYTLKGNTCINMRDAAADPVRKMKCLLPCFPKMSASSGLNLIVSTADKQT